LENLDIIIKMKNKNSLVSASMIIFLVMLIGLVSADANITYNVYNATIDDSGNLITTSNSISGFYVEGYVCTSANCATTNSVPFLTSTYSSGSSVIVGYPPVIMDANGYVLYFYKDGYIGYEQFANWYGNGVDNGSNIYLSKLETGHAPLDSLNVVNQVETNMLIEVGVNVSIDANTYSAIEDNTVSDITLNESVLTLVTLNIINSTGAVVNTSNQTLNINYSESVPVNFIFDGFATGEDGDYTFEVTTDVIDDKIITSVQQLTSSEVTVIPAGLTNYTYTLIQDLEMNSTYPVIGETIGFTFDYLSNYVNETGGLENATTTAYINLYRNGTSLYSTDTISLPLAINSNSSTFESRPFTILGSYFNETGSYVIEVIGTPDSSQGTQAINTTQTLVFSIGTADNGGAIDDDDDDDDDNGGSNDDDEEDDDDDELERLTLKLQKSTSSDGSSSIDLTPNKLSSLEILQRFMWWVFWLIVLLVLIIIMNVFREFWFWILLGILVFILFLIGLIKLSWLLVAFLIALAIILISGFFKFFR